MTTPRQRPDPQAENGHPEHDHATPGWWRSTGCFGLAWFVLFAFGAIFLQSEPPASDQPLDDIRAFFAMGADRYLIGDYIAGLAFVLCFLPFIAGVQSVLGDAEGGPRIASRLVFAGGLTTVVVGGGATSFLDAIALGGAATSLDDSTIRGLLNANAVAIAAIGPAMALTTFAAAVAIWRTSVLWRWLAPLGVLSGLLHLVGALYVVPNDGSEILFLVRFGGLISFSLFVVLTSINLIKGQAKHTRPTPSQ